MFSTFVGLGRFLNCQRPDPVCTSPLRPQLHRPDGILAGEFAIIWKARRKAGEMSREGINLVANMESSQSGGRNGRIRI